MQPDRTGAVEDVDGAGRVVDGAGAGVVVVVGRGVAVGDGVGAAVGDGDGVAVGLGVAPDPNSDTQSSNHARARSDKVATPAACRSTHHWPS
jgi:hypothetical protein